MSRQENESTPNPRNTPPRRKSLSFRHATESDLETISYTIPLSRWGHAADLHRREKRVLRLFCALHRSGTIGFSGITAYQSAIARTVARASDGEPAGLRTVQRALKGLCNAGYLTAGKSYNRPIRLGVDTWTRDQKRIYTLTAKAIAIWAASSSSPPAASSSSPPAASRSSDEVAAGLELLAELRAGRAELLAGLEVLATPAASSSSPASILHFPTHDKMTDIRSPDSGYRNIRDPIGTLSDTSTDLRLVNSINEVSDRTSPEFTPAPRGPNRSENRKEQNPRQRNFLKSVPSSSRKITIDLILAELRKYLCRRGHAGRLAIARAALQIADPAADSPIAWDYWIAAWPAMTPDTRHAAIVAEIAPALTIFSSSAPSASSSAPSASSSAPSASSSAPSASSSTPSASSSTPSFEAEKKRLSVQLGLPLELLNTIQKRILF